VNKVTRSDAFLHGCEIFHPSTREKIDPITARALARNKRIYDQNYECVFEDDNLALLTHDLITAAERPNVGLVCEHDWSAECLALLKAPLPATAGRKSAQQWIDEATDETAMYRCLLMNVCNGSGDRLERLIKSGFDIGLDEVFDDYRADNGCFGQRHLFAGIDVGRNRDRTVISVVERLGNLYIVRAILRLDEMRLPEQQQRLETLLTIHAVRMVKIDATGIGLGLFEYTQNKFPDRVQGVNFSTTVPLGSSPSPRWGEGRGEVRTPTVRITEQLATQLLQTYEDRAIHQPIDNTLRDDLRKPERLLSPSGRVSIAATRDEAGHADHFWSLALAIDAAKTPIAPPFYWTTFTMRRPVRFTTL
jgi:hypothetical protein